MYNCPIGIRGCNCQLLWLLSFSSCTGASVIANHADLLSNTGFITALTRRFESSSTYAFPHVYAQLYITPPGASAVAAHADDRDVFIIQLYGSKRWTVYEKVPTLLPFQEEQVGKNGISVPATTLNGRKTLDDKRLEAGSVLYMPRGVVHSARCGDGDGGSIHVTIAVPTAHWSVRESVKNLMKQRKEEPGQKSSHSDSAQIMAQISQLAQKIEQYGEAEVDKRVWREALPLAAMNTQTKIGTHLTVENTIATVTGTATATVTVTSRSKAEEDKLRTSALAALAGAVVAECKAASVGLESFLGENTSDVSSNSESTAASALESAFANIQRTTIEATNAWRSTMQLSYATRRNLSLNRAAARGEKRRKLGAAAGSNVTWQSRVKWSSDVDKSTAKVAAAAAVAEWERKNMAESAECGGRGGEAKSSGLMASEIIADAVGEIVGGVKGGENSNGGGLYTVSELTQRVVAAANQGRMCGLTVLVLVREVVENGAFMLVT